MNNGVWYVTTVANEEDIIFYTLTHMLKQGVDGIIVADNLSTDNTWGILHDIAWKCNPKAQVLVISDDDPAHRQGKKMTALAFTAAMFGAKWIIPGDADELIYSMDSSKTVADVIRSCNNQVIGIPMWNHWETALDKVLETNPYKRMVWRCKEQNPLDKVAYRFDPALNIDEGNHRIMYGKDPVAGVAMGLGIRHFPYRGADHFVRKAERGIKALEAATELNSSIGAHWRQYGQTLREHGPDALIGHYKRYFYFEYPEGTMAYDPAPYSGE